MPFEPLAFLALVLLGGAVAVDGTSVGQFMVSRPFVAATLAGAIVGAPLAGASIGLVLEAFQLTVLPVGAARYPEGGPAAVAAAAVFASAEPTAAALLVTTLVTLLLEWLGGESVCVMRRMNIKLLSIGHGQRMSAIALERRHLLAVALDFARGMILVPIGIAVLWVTTQALTPYWGLSEAVTQLLVTASVAGLLAAAARMVGWRSWLLAAGAIFGVVLVLLDA